ncbi:MAG: carbohydrate ABC transporter permease [Acidimicrobiales bacterium]
MAVVIPARRRALLAVAHHAALLTVAIVFLAPIAFIGLTALMTDRQTLSPHLWPHPFRWSNFATVFRTLPLWRLTWTTTKIAGLSTLGVVVSSVPVAYALACLRWRGRQVTLLLVLATYMLPVQVTIVPIYVVFAKLHWIGTLKPLILPSFFGDAFSIFLLRQFFLTVPGELIDAARAEGASELQVLTRVVVPMAKPAIAAVALFNFLFAWNDLFGPLLYLSQNEKLWTLSLSLSNFRSEHHVQWNLTMAASLLFMVPVIVVFLLAQRVFIQGVTITGRAPGAA